MSKKVLKIFCITTMIIMLVILAGINQISYAISGSGTATYTVQHYGTDIHTTESVSWGISSRVVTNTSTGEKLTVFCSEHHVSVSEHTPISSTYYTISSSETLKSQAAKVAYFGWYKTYGDYVFTASESSERSKAYAFTQVYVWETLRTRRCNFYRF